MNTARIRALWKKITPFVLLGAALGTAGAAAKMHFARDCCRPGASCCFPGSPCCHGSAQGLAQR
jgi:hypothetical protein